MTGGDKRGHSQQARYIPDPNETASKKGRAVPVQQSENQCGLLVHGRDTYEDGAWTSL